MGVWACSSGHLIFGSRLTRVAVEAIRGKLVKEPGQLERPEEDQWDEDEDEDESIVTLEKLNINLNHWLKLRRVQHALVTVAAGVKDTGSPLHALVGEPGLLQLTFSFLMPTRAPEVETAIVIDEAEAQLATDGQAPDPDRPRMSPRCLAVERAIESLGGPAVPPRAPPDASVHVLAHWSNNDQRLHQLHFAHHHEVEIKYATTFEGYGESIPFYLLCVTGEQDSPRFGGEKKLGGYNDGNNDGVDYCDPIGVFSAPVGGFAKITEAINELRGAGAFPDELTKEELDSGAAGWHQSSVPYVGKVGWNVVGHSHVG